jgi:dipeptidyl aminopeptidase/acylaminoacyl peptidase
VNNWVSFFGSSDAGWGFGSYVGSYPFEDAEAHLRISPSTYAARISTPLLLVHSEEDLRAPVEQAEHLFTILRLLGKEVEFLRFPGESHELSRSGSPAHRLMRFEAILDWFAGYLQVDG